MNRLAASGSWLSSWRLAMRLARRDIARNRLRSALVMGLVVAPIALVIAALVYVASAEPTNEQRTTWSMGAASAVVQPMISGDWQPPCPEDVCPPTENSERAQGGKITRPSGWKQGISTKEAAAIVSKVAGGARVIPLTSYSVELPTKNGGSRELTAVALPNLPQLAGKATLTSGRWPAGPDEIAVNDIGGERGLPSTGPVTLRLAGKERAVKIVGTINAYEPMGGYFDVVSAEPLVTSDPTESSWLVLSARTYRYPQLLEAADQGMRIIPRAYSLNPARYPSFERDGGVIADSGFLVPASVLLLLFVAMMTSPAFAIIASSSQRSTGLLALNGAPRSQLRRVLLAQAFLLGVVGAMMGFVLGLVSSAVIVALVHRFRPGTTFGDLQPPFKEVFLVVGVGIAAVLLSALWPALTSRRVSVIAQVRGQVSAQLPRMWIFALGAVLALSGTLGTTAALLGQGPGVLVMAGPIAMLLGAILVVPGLLRGAAALAGMLPLPFRMATRDALRNGGRAVPTISALIAGVALVTIVAVTGETFRATERANYVYRALEGEAAVVPVDGVGQASLDKTRRQIASVNPSFKVTPMASVAMPLEPSSEVRTIAIPEAEICQGKARGSCHRQFNLDAAPTPSVLPAAAIVERWKLNVSQAALIRAGAWLSLASGPGQGKARVLEGRVRAGQSSGEVAVTWLAPPKRRSVPVVHTAAMPGALGGFTASTWVIPREWATGQGLAVVTNDLRVSDPRGAISAADEQALRDLLPNTTVERGPSPRGAWLLRGIYLAAAALMLMISLVATALSLGQQAADSATLSAVGATRAHRRSMAAASVLTMASIGVLVGMVIGWWPGVTLARAISVGEVRVPVQYPWRELLAAFIIPTVLASLGARWMVRSAPTVTRRL